MKRRFHLPSLALAIPLLLSAHAPPPAPAPGDAKRGADAKPALMPGAVIRLTFPDLPPTLFNMTRSSKLPPPMVSVRVPDNYKPDGSVPLLVWLDINDGGVGTEIAQPMRIVGNDNYIVANFPLFRRTFDPTESWGIAVGVDDCAVMASAYTTIMNRIRATIPNIDPQRSIIGGFSNGGHAVAALLSTLDDNTLKSFNGFFMIDSGFDWTGYKRTAELGKRHILYMTGGGGLDNDDWWRKDVVDRVHYFRRCAEHMGVPPQTWRFEVMPGRGHEFPDEYLPILREWAAGVRAAEQ